MIAFAFGAFTAARQAGARTYDSKKFVGATICDNAGIGISATITSICIKTNVNTIVRWGAECPPT